MKKCIFALISGALFALGLVVSGMTQPAKVIGFLNITPALQGAQGISWAAELGKWDPSLAFVMGGALMVTFLAFAITPRQGKKPWCSTQFDIPTVRHIDRPLVLGAMLFGVGWGLVGYCPGPAIASLFTGGQDALLFIVAMCVGMFIAKKTAVKTTFKSAL